jgi:hypothetical protein
MPALDLKKMEQAFSLRLQGKSFAEIARTLHMAPRTLRKLEHGWVDKKGVHHPGWRADLERVRGGERKAEVECGLALREERVKAFKRLAQLAIEKVEAQFSAIAIETVADWKMLASEIRELIGLLAEEVDGRRGAGKAVRSGWATSPRTHITLEDIQEAYEESRAREAEAAGYGEPSVPGSTRRDGEADTDVVLDPLDANLN